MSDLTRFRDHCRAMAVRPRKLKEAEPPASERALWTQLADEVDAYLGRPSLVVDLFGEGFVEDADQ